METAAPDTQLSERIPNAVEGAVEEAEKRKTATPACHREEIGSFPIDAAISH